MSSADRSAEARSAKVDLSDAIDQTAARMLAVADDPELATRIVAALPERSSRRGWLIPQFAALGAIVIAAVIWSTRERPEVPALLPSTEMATVMALPGGIAPREPGTPVTPPLERREPLEPLEALEPFDSDFDRSLPALEVAALTEVAPLTLAPIEIGELPLMAETLSPNKFE